MAGGDAVEPDGSNGPHVFVADLDHPVLSDDDDHHLRRALRLRDGEPLTLSDGGGGWRPARFGAVIEPTGDEVRVGEPVPALTVAFALTKAAKPDLAVQKLTELGMDRIILFSAERSVARWDDTKVARNMGRMRRIAREAAMQSRRVRLPEVTMVDTFEAASTLPGAHRADMSGDSLDGCTTILVGPEGGWSPTEREALPGVRLGPHVLRAETAAVAAATLLAHHHRS